MAKEIERKFLVDKNKLPQLENGQNIIQGYLSEQPQIRVRLITQSGIEKASMAYKTPPVGLTREEIEFIIPLKEAKELMAQTNVKLEKTRFLIGRFEIDVYGGKNDGLVVAEIELKSEDEEIGPLPVWIRHEVTGDKRYGNVTLAKEAINKSLI